MNVSAVIVTRGDCDLTPCFEPLAEAGITDIVVWDNSTADRDLSVYGRYEAIGAAVGAAILVQDDDVILDAESVRSLIDAYVPGHVVCNMPQRFRDTGAYEDSALVGFGAIFDRDLPGAAFDRYFAWDAREHKRPWIKGVTTTGLGSFGFDVDPWAQAFFYRECDCVFTALTPVVLADLPYTDREFASASDRLWRQPGHAYERERMRQLVRQIRDAA